MNYVIVYLEIEHLLNFLTQEEKGDFLDLLIKYAKDREIPKTENKNLINVFNFMKGRLDLQFEKARIRAETARKNGASGGRISKDKKPRPNPKEPNGTQWVVSQFEEFWNLYDKKLDRKTCEEKFRKALKISTFEEIMQGLKKYVKHRSEDIKYWKHPKTWLHNQCWKDEYSTANKNDNKQGKFAIVCDFINKMIEDTLIKEISVSASNAAVFHLTEENWNKLINLDEELRKKIKFYLQAELNTNKIEPKLI